MIYSKIVASGSGIPARIVPNQHFSYLVDDADEWIHSRTGIRERRFAEADQSTADLAVLAARDALARGEIDPLDLDGIIVATSTPDMILPATACMVQREIGARNACCFDMNAVCSSFVFALDMADSYIKAGKFRNIMVIGADTYSKILDFQDKSTCPLFGDGAGAAILSAEPERRGILASSMRTDGTRWELIQVPSSGSRKPITPETIAARENTFKMEGKKVFIFATEVIPRVIEEVTAKAGMRPEQLDYIIPHQANVRMIDFIAKKFAMDKAKFLLNLDRFGNTAAASVGLALDENLRNGTIRPGHLVLVMGFGGGLSWGGLLIQF